MLDDPLGNLPAELFLWPGAASYTRQPVAEIHTIGSPPVLAAVQAALCAAGARLAQPGEFTMRAFLAGRLDLTQSEAVLGVIDAENEAGLRRGLSQLAGGISGPLGRLRDSLVDLLADLEAGLDFADEHIEFVSRQALLARIAAAHAQIDAVAEDLRLRGSGPEAPTIVFWGPPNAGKSTLVGALAGKPAAIVAPTPGTTRDYVSIPWELAGAPVTLVDTAGLSPERHEADDRHPIDAAASALAVQQRSAAAVHCLMLDAATTQPLALDRSRGVVSSLGAKPDLVIANKIDVLDNEALSTWEAAARRNTSLVLVSAARGRGLSQLKQRLAETLDRASAVTTCAPATAVRCAASVRGAGAALARSRAAITEGAGEELIAADLREALTHLGEMIGAVYTDDILDRVFSRFCIGK